MALKASFSTCSAYLSSALFRSSLRRSSIFDCSVDDLIHAHAFVRCSLLLLLGSPRFCVLLENLDSHWTPIRSAKRAVKRFSVTLIVLEATHETVSMDLPSAAVSTMREIFTFSKSVAADTAHLLLLEGSRRHYWPIISRVI